MNAQSQLTSSSDVSPDEPTRNSWNRFALVGGLLGVFYPFACGAWLFAKAGCGTSALGGILIIVFGCPVGGIAGAAVGAAVGLLFGLIRFASKRSQGIAAITVATIAVIATCAAVIIHIQREAREAAIRSYALSVLDAVERFQLVHGHLPDSLTEIETADLDYDCGIPLHALQYEVTGGDCTISYSMGDEDVISVHGGGRTTNASAE